MPSTLAPPPKKFEGPSSSLVCSHRRGIHDTVVKARHELGVAPWQDNIFTSSTKSELAVKVAEVVGLHLPPSDNSLAQAR